MNTLFGDDRPVGTPLAERMRPSTLEGLFGQQHLLGPQGPLRSFLDRNTLPSMILWGPPGTGKTTLAHVVTTTLGWPMTRLSAVEAGVKELRETLQRAEAYRRTGEPFVLFIDEIHRFNKGQQDALLHAVERGVVTVIGATTENPSFEVNAALLSRCQVYTLQLLTDENIREIIEHALLTDQVLRSQNVVVDDLDVLVELAGGDARTALNALETAVLLAQTNAEGVRHITRDVITMAVQRRIARYDKTGDAHYDTISAFIKSLRGSDPDAALFYLAVMIDAGEDPTFIARRLIIFASEDIGNADPHALTLAVSTFQALERIGMPEGRIPLSQCTTYLASTVKSNASYVAINTALDLVRKNVRWTVPLHLRNAPTRLMKESGYGEEYKYPHNYPGHYVDVRYLPDEIPDLVLYNPDGMGREGALAERLHALRPARYQEQSVNQTPESGEITT